MTWNPRIAKQLAERKQQGLWRTRQAVEAEAGGQIRVQGVRYNNFSSNDYLGLSQHPQVIEAWCAGAQRWGTGAGASGHVTGYSLVQQQLEQRLADWLGYPRALLFGSGFSANQALIFSLAQRGDLLITDKLMHASLQEAAWLSPASVKRYPHNSMAALTRLLTPQVAGERLVATEGVFSMDGDLGALPEIEALCQQQQCDWLVDDAHGFGVLGEQGKGTCNLLGVKPSLLLITFGKALGVGGAALLCNEAMADYLEQTARHLIYSTAMPAAQWHAVDTALTLIQQQPELRHQLAANIRLFRQQMQDSAWRLKASETAIQPLIIGDNNQAVSVAEQLRQQGHWVSAIRPPTVPLGSARLRITLSALHCPEQITRLTKALHELAESHNFSA